MAVNLSEPTREEIRQSIKEQCCWWCGRDGWKSLGGHIALAHGIPAVELREAAGLVKSVPLCDLDYSAFLGAAATEGTIHSNFKGRRSRGKGSRSFGEAGKEVQRRKLKAYENRVGADVVKAMRVRAARVAASTRRKPHWCTGCGVVWIPLTTPRTCSTGCRKVVRQRTARRTNQRRIVRLG